MGFFGYRNGPRALRLYPSFHSYAHFSRCMASFLLCTVVFGGGFRAPALACGLRPPPRAFEESDAASLHCVSGGHTLTHSGL